jgi:hypothetical protein
MTTLTISALGMAMLLGLIGLVTLGLCRVRCPAGRAVVLGAGRRGARIITQGTALRRPFVERVDLLDLRPLAVSLPLPGGGEAEVEVVVDRQPEQLQRAACRLLGLEDTERAALLCTLVQSLVAQQPTGATGARLGEAAGPVLAQLGWSLTRLEVRPRGK